MDLHAGGLADDSKEDFYLQCIKWLPGRTEASAKDTTSVNADAAPESTTTSQHEFDNYLSFQWQNRRQKRLDVRIVGVNTSGRSTAVSLTTVCPGGDRNAVAAESDASAGASADSSSAAGTTTAATGKKTKNKRLKKDHQPGSLHPLL